jgi:proline iminopeptidase
MSNVNARSLFAAMVMCAGALLTVVDGTAYAQDPQQVKHSAGKFITLLGHKIWYETAGQGEPLVLIPGAGGAHDYFHPFFASLERSFRVIYFDGFGRGNSDHATSPTEYTFEHDLDEVEALRQALQLGKIAIYGHSYGGFVAQGYALKYPGSVSKVIVSNIFASGQEFQESDDHINAELQQFFPEYWQQLAALRARGLTSSSAEMQQASAPIFPATFQKFYWCDPNKASAIAPFFNEHNFSAEQWNAMAGPDADFHVGGDLIKLDFRGQLSTVKVPMLVIAGRCDGIVLPRFTTEFKKYAPKATFVMFEHSGHYPFVEEPSLFLKTITDFLK